MKQARRKQAVICLEGSRKPLSLKDRRQQIILRKKRKTNNAPAVTDNDTTDNYDAAANHRKSEVLRSRSPMRLKPSEQRALTMAL